MVFLPTDAFKTIIAYAGHNYQQKHKLMMQGVMEVLDSLPKDWLADAIECGWFYDEHGYENKPIDQLWDEYIKPKYWEFHSVLKDWMEIVSFREDNQMDLLEYENFFHKPKYVVPAFWMELAEQHGFGSVIKYRKIKEDGWKLSK